MWNTQVKENKPKSGFAKKHLPQRAFVCNESGKPHRIEKMHIRFSIATLDTVSQE